ncbi:MAG: PhnD/SsuA/transferrin family substrate-binding protein [Gammaproteobacteria bacterium]|jgi:phosphonate transport system substrate-binding protein|nr:PhnD/SsuA/transferrin family substrate-binding protein [Gammaproteobacteria bacterium]MBU4280366.1 PhnD/SsuA/transferrin family substrate-binding protein [Gammaproteobacteria bacterium]MBU4508462.1 PhnD/SsuA/transferrin family substrate-binding protein [Gammaproteobacteria bacterium]OGB36598.1 MAG: phosphonate ABC transporter substrate-binding protein [Burkholderiales bacterium RIFCSPLOWO2_02_FULL_66_35]
MSVNRRRYLAAGVCGAAAAAVSLPSWGADRLRIGLTPVILADQVAFLSRWGRYLGSRVGVDVEFVARESYQSILDLLFSGQIDAAWICGYPFVRFESELSLLAVPLYQGQPFYQAYLIRPKTPVAEIQGWADLKGRVLAYSDPLSNSGWLVAQAQLGKAGVPVRDLKRGFFTHGHRNVAEAVAARLAQAGSIDGYVWETMRAQGMPAIAKTEVIWKSEPFGFPPLVVRKGHEHPQMEALRQALLHMGDDKVGRDLLASLNLTGFTLGQASLFDSIRRQARQVPGSGVGG